MDFIVVVEQTSKERRKKTRMRRIKETKKSQFK